MKAKKVLPLKRYKDLENFVCELAGERHGFFPHKSVEVIINSGFEAVQGEGAEVQGQGDS